MDPKSNVVALLGHAVSGVFKTHKKDGIAISRNRMKNRNGPI